MIRTRGELLVVLVALAWVLNPTISFWMLVAVVPIAVLIGIRVWRFFRKSGQPLGGVSIVQPPFSLPDRTIERVDPPRPTGAEGREQVHTLKQENAWAEINPAGVRCGTRGVWDVWNEETKNDFPVTTCEGRPGRKAPVTTATRHGSEDRA